MCKTHPHTLVFCKNVLLSRHGRTVDGINANNAKNKAFLNLLLQQTGKKESVQPTGFSSSLRRNHSLMVKKKKTAIFIKTIQRATLRATYRNLTVALRSFSLSLSLSLSLSHFSCDSCEASANPETPSENKVSLLVPCLQGIHLPDRHAGRGRRKGRGEKKESERGNLLPSSSTLIMTDFFFPVLRRKRALECGGFGNSLRSAS